MAHILILKATEHEEIVNHMFKAANEVITSYSHTYDEITVPSAKELPIALTLYAESLNYEAVICIGAFLKDESVNLSHLHAQEVLRNLYDYESYYGIPIGCVVIQIQSIKLTDINKIISFAQSISNNTAIMLQTIRQLNSLESEKYAQNRKHN